MITIEDKAMENISLQFGLYQVINEPANIFESSSPYIDCVFTLQKNFVTASGVHRSLHSNSHH